MVWTLHLTDSHVIPGEPGPTSFIELHMEEYDMDMSARGTLDLARAEQVARWIATVHEEHGYKAFMALVEYVRGAATEDGMVDAVIEHVKHEVRPRARCFLEERLAAELEPKLRAKGRAELLVQQLEHRFGKLPAPEGGAGGTVFWTTGAVLLKYGENKEEAGQYMNGLIRDQRIWENKIFIDKPILWIRDPFWAKVLVIAAITWRWTGYNMIFFLAAMQNIDKSIYEAARIDGVPGTAAPIPIDFLDVAGSSCVSAARSTASCRWTETASLANISSACR